MSAAPAGYSAALETAWAELRKIDREAQTRSSGGVIEDGHIVIEVLGRRCLVDLDGGRVVIDGNDAPFEVALLALHYLAGATDVEPSGRPLSYRQLPGGNVFYPAFKARTVDAIGAMFGRDPGGALEALDDMGATRGEGGDAARVVRVLPRLPVTIVLWNGDEELPASASVLFDETAPRFLHIEDLAAAGTLIAERIGRRLAGPR